MQTLLKFLRFDCFRGGRILSSKNWISHGPGQGTIRFNHTGTRVEKNRQARLELAVAYRALERYNLHEGTCNHLSLMAPSSKDDDDVMLIIPHGLHWSRVTASSLLGLNDQNEIVEGGDKGEGAEISAATIHRGIHEIRQDLNCIMHTHPPHATTIANLENPHLLMLHQNLVRFSKSVAYDTAYSGLSECVDEGQRLGRLLGHDKNVLMMCNHGVITAAPSVAVAFDTLYYLERAAMLQVLALSTGQKIRFIPDNVVEQTYEQFQRYSEPYAFRHFNAMMEVVMQDSPDVAD